MFKPVRDSLAKLDNTQAHLLCFDQFCGKPVVSTVVCSACSCAVLVKDKKKTTQQYNKYSIFKCMEVIDVFITTWLIMQPHYELCNSGMWVVYESSNIYYTAIVIWISIPVIEFSCDLAIFFCGLIKYISSHLDHMFRWENLLRPWDRNVLWSTFLSELIVTQGAFTCCARKQR